MSFQIHSRRPWRLGASFSALACIAALTACAPPVVVRSIDGHDVAGRFIDVRAYALYARAADAEVHGEASVALELYTAAATEDNDSPEIWARVGALRCALGGRAGDWSDAFKRSLERDREYEPAWRELARCALGTGDLKTANDAANSAILFDPDRVDTAVLHASITERLGRVDDARHELEALTIRAPESIDAWRALYELARRTHDEPAAARAARAIRGMSPDAASSIAAALPELDALFEIDAALSRGDLASARRRATTARMLSSEVAVRAAALGQIDAAREQGALVSEADPSDSSARIALAVAADLARDDAGVDRALRGLEVPITPPSRLARLLLAELIERRVSKEAARAWLKPAEPGAPDPLLVQVEARVVTRLYEGMRQASPGLPTGPP